MLQKIDLWIVDHVFQPIVDWGNKHLDVTKSFFLVVSFCLFGAGLLFDTYLELSNGRVPIIALVVGGVFVFWGPNLISYIIRRAEKEEKGGFAPKSRTDSWDMAMRLMYLFLIVTEVHEAFFSGVIDIRESLDPIAFLSVWSLLGFLACRNNPPMFKKKVPSPA